MKKISNQNLPSRTKLNKYKKQLSNILSEILSQELQLLSKQEQPKKYKSLSKNNQLLIKNPSDRSKSVEGLQKYKSKTVVQSSTNISSNIKNIGSTKIANKNNQQSYRQLPNTPTTLNNTSKALKSIPTTPKKHNYLQKPNNISKQTIKKKTLNKKCIKISQLNLRYGNQKTETDNIHKQIDQNRINPQNPQQQNLVQKNSDENQEKIRNIAQKQRQFYDQSLKMYKQQNFQLENQLRNTYNIIKQLKIELQKFSQSKSSSKLQKKLTITKLDLPSIASTNHPVSSHRSFCKNGCQKVCRCLVQNFRQKQIIK